jgi:predicted amino acid racemase
MADLSIVFEKNDLRPLGARNVGHGANFSKIMMKTKHKYTHEGIWTLELYNTIKMRMKVYNMENKHCCEIYKFSVMKTKHNCMYVFL